MEKLKKWWHDFEAKNPKLSQWVREGGLFLIISQAITLFRGLFKQPLTDLFVFLGASSAEWGWPNVVFYLFGKPIDFKIFGFGAKDGGFAAFIAFWILSFVFEVLNFYLQRKYTFRSNGNLWFQCPIYFAAWVFAMILVNAAFSIVGGLLAGILPNEIIDILMSFLQGSISVVVMFFVNKIIFTDAPKQEELAK